MQPLAGVDIRARRRVPIFPVVWALQRGLAVESGGLSLLRYRGPPIEK